MFQTILVHVKPNLPCLSAALISPDANLMQVTGVKQKTDIVQFAARFCPEARTSVALALAVDDLCNEYSHRKARP